jgi:hypothetical protein
VPTSYAEPVMAHGETELGHDDDPSGGRFAGLEDPRVPYAP